MSAPEQWSTDHDEAVGDIVDEGNNMLDELFDMLVEIAETAKFVADELRTEAAIIAEVDPIKAEELENQADEIEAAAIVAIYALADAMAEEGSKKLLDMCGNAGQTAIIDNAIPDFQDICNECADEAAADLGA